MLTRYARSSLTLSSLKRAYQLPGTLPLYPSPTPRDLSEIHPSYPPILPSSPPLSSHGPATRFRGSSAAVRGQRRCRSHCRCAMGTGHALAWRVDGTSSSVLASPCVLLHARVQRPVRRSLGHESVGRVRDDTITAVSHPHAHCCRTDQRQTQFACCHSASPLRESLDLTFDEFRFVFGALFTAYGLPNVVLPMYVGALVRRHGQSVVIGGAVLLVLVAGLMQVVGVGWKSAALLIAGRFVLGRIIDGSCGVSVGYALTMTCTCIRDLRCA